MESAFRFVAPPSPCGYLPTETWSLEYEFHVELTAAEYMERMLGGWRRFGRALFRPRCQACQACQPIRIPVSQFQPDRSQRRNAKANDGIIQLRIGQPQPTPAKLRLYNRYHAFQADHKGWPQHPAKDIQGYIESFVDNPFETEEWCYYLGSRLVGVGYVDNLPGGLSAIYFYYDPDHRQRSLGIWNVLSVLRRGAELALPHCYLGYYVAGCQSMQYKASFRPNEVRAPNGIWRPFS
jgi:arginine-tRNA-protein transferase